MLNLGGQKAFPDTLPSLELKKIKIFSVAHCDILSWNTSPTETRVCQIAYT